MLTLFAVDACLYLNLVQYKQIKYTVVENGSGSIVLWNFDSLKWLSFVW